MTSKIIGLVLPSFPAYSETFFHSKIQGLEKNGYTVILFINDSHFKESTNYTIKKQFPIFNKFFQVFIMLFLFLFLLLFKNKTILKFIALEKASKRNTLQIIKNIYLNAHIFLTKVDILHFGFATTTLGKENTAKAIKAKMVVSFRGFDISIYPLKNKNCYDLLWKNIDTVHTISDDLYHEALNLGLSKDTPYIKITPAINTDYFQPETLNKIHNKIKFLTVARLHWKKGIDYALEALAKLNKAGVDFEYTIVGEGNEFERLKFAAYQFNILDKVNFVGKKKPSDIKIFMQEHNIYLQPSVQEGFCNAVLEAQSMGMLCVVSDAQGLSENVLDQQTGWVIKKRDALMLYNTIINIVGQNQKDLHKIQKNAMQRIQNDFNIQTQITKFIELYKGLYS